MIRSINGKSARILSGTASTTPVPPIFLTYLGYVYVPENTFKSPEVLKIRASILKSGTGNLYTVRLYWNTSLDVSGAVQLAQFQMGTTLQTQFIRRININSEVLDPGPPVSILTNLKLLDVTYNGNDDRGDYPTITSELQIANFRSSDSYFFLTVDGAGGRISDTISCLYITAEV